MFNTFTFILIGFIFFIFAILCSMFKLLIIYREAIIRLESKLGINFVETLELATSEQLLKELRKRPNSPFILLSPVKEKDCNGIIIESHNMNSVSCLAMLHLAKEIAIQNMKKKGENTPPLPSLEDYFEEEE